MLCAVCIIYRYTVCRYAVEWLCMYCVDTYKVIDFITLVSCLHFSGGETSFAALEKGHQQQQRKLDDIRAMQQQIHQLQVLYIPV